MVRANEKDPKVEARRVKAQQALSTVIKDIEAEQANEIELLKAVVSASQISDDTIYIDHSEFMKLLADRRRLGDLEEKHQKVSTQRTEFAADVVNLKRENADQVSKLEREVKRQQDLIDELKDASFDYQVKIGSVTIAKLERELKLERAIHDPITGTVAYWRDRALKSEALLKKFTVGDLSRRASLLEQELRAEVDARTGIESLMKYWKGRAKRAEKLNNA